jgi:uncharacterized protein
MTITTSEHAAQTAVREHLRLLTDRRMDAWVQLFADDGVMEFPYAPPGVPGEVRGHDALLAHMGEFAESVDIAVVDLVFHVSVDPHVAVAEFGTTGHATATGKPYRQRCVVIVHVDDEGRIVRFSDYWNPLVAMEAFTPDGRPSS